MSGKHRVQVDWWGVVRAKRDWDSEVLAAMHPVTAQILAAVHERHPGWDCERAEGEAMLRMVEVALGARQTDAGTRAGVRDALGLPERPRQPVPAVIASVATFSDYPRGGERSASPRAPSLPTRPGAAGLIVPSVSTPRGYER